MKKFLALFAVLSVSAIAAPIGTCVPGKLSGSIGNACALGDKVFDSFAYSGDIEASDTNIDFQMASMEFHLILAPITEAGFFGTLSFVDRIRLHASVAPYIPPAYSPMPDTETAGPAFFAPPSSTVTATTLTTPDGNGAVSPGLSSPELDFLQDSTLVPEPASFALIGTGLLCFGLLRKRAA